MYEYSLCGCKGFILKERDTGFIRYKTMHVGRGNSFLIERKLRLNGFDISDTKFPIYEDNNVKFWIKSRVFLKKEYKGFK
jgi:hypothetical protein